MADFNFYLNRQGVRGQKGEQGEQGFSPIITVGTNTLSEYTLLIQTQDSSFETVNLREHKEDLGGTYIRYNRNTGVMYAGDVDNATTESLGVVRFATDAEAQAGSEETVITPAQVDSKIEELDNEIQTNLLNYVQRTELSAYALRTDLNNYVPISQLSSLVDLSTVQNISARKNFRNGIGTTSLVGLQDGIYIFPYSNGSYPEFIVGANNNYFDNISLLGKKVIIGSNSNGKFMLDSDNGDLEVTASSFTIRRSGRINDNIDSGNIEDYLPIATTSDVGVVKPDGTTITIDSNGTLHGSSTYILPTASTNTLGGVKVDGITITIDANGVISGASTYVLPTASTTTLGGVKVDGTTITIDSNGVISSQGGGSTYTAGNGIDITNDVISIDTSIVAEKTDIPTVPTNISAFTNDSGYITSSSLSNYMDLSSAQTSTGVKTFSAGITTNLIKSQSTGNDLLRDRPVGGTHVLFLGNSTVNDITCARSGGYYTNIDTGNLDTELGNSAVIADKVDASELTDITELYPTLGGLAMPSNVYTDLTLGASGTTYNAPANGYFVFGKRSSGAQYIDLLNQTSRLETNANSTGTGQNITLVIPAHKGDTIQTNYSFGGTTNIFRFVYAVGSESEA